MKVAHIFVITFTYIKESICILHYRTLFRNFTFYIVIFVNLLLSSDDNTENDQYVRYYDE